MAGFSWLTFGQAKAELATRLFPVGGFWSDTERGRYIAWAMRIFNCLTAFWVAEYPITLQSPFTNWNAANGSGSPRQPILSDIDIYTMMEYMLLEPPTGGTWTGTNQFSIEALAQAVQGRRDETLQVGATSVTEITLPLTPGTSRATLPDTALDVLRVRWVPATDQGSPAVLQRGDAESFRTFTPGYLQTTEPPLRWDVISGPPLALTLDTLSPVPATLQVLIMQAEPVPVPPAATPLGMPDDWAWVPLFGALADVLAAQEEARDTQRAEYARKRYLEGMAWLKHAPWLMVARITNMPVATPSVIAADRFNYGWQTNAAAFPQVVVAGVDLYGVSPTPTAATSVMPSAQRRTTTTASNTAPATARPVWRKRTMAACRLGRPGNGPSAAPCQVTWSITRSSPASRSAWVRPGVSTFGSATGVSRAAKLRFQSVTS